MPAAGAYYRARRMRAPDPEERVRPEQFANRPGSCVVYDPAYGTGGCRQVVAGNLREPRASKISSEGCVSAGGELSQLSDAQLVSRAQRGDTAAFGALIGRYQDRVYNACYRLCGHEADALDLTQTAFLRAFEALDRFEARSNFYTWIFRIATNLCISHLRSRARRTVVPLVAAAGEVSWIDPPADTARHDPHHRLERDELRARLEAALRALDPDFRVVLVLRDIEDMDYATIGQVLGIAVGTVKSRVFRARMMLRSALDSATEQSDEAVEARQTRR